MSLGFGHLIGAWAPAKIIECYRKVEFSKWVWIFFLFGAILPDADFLLEWLHIMENAHRTFMNSLVFIPVVWVLTYYLVRLAGKWLPKKETPKSLAWAITLGVTTHTFYDSLFFPGVNLLWPFDWWFAGGTFYFATDTLYQRVGGTIQELNKTNLFIIDMAMGTAWLFYFMIKGRLKP